jgi:hypothetical protein
LTAELLIPFVTLCHIDKKGFSSIGKSQMDMGAKEVLQLMMALL